MRIIPGLILTAMFLALFFGAGLVAQLLTGGTS